MNLNRLFSISEGTPPSEFGFRHIFGMIGALGSAAIGAIGGAISGNKSNKANIRENQKDRDFQHKEAELSFQRQKQLIDEQNQYNSYANQRKLAEQAGLNPNRIFDQGAAGIATSSASTDAPQASGMPGRSVSPVLSAQDVQSASAAALNFANAKLANKQEEAVGAQIGYTDESTRQVRLQNISQELQNGILSEFGRYEKILDIKQKDAQVAFTDAQTDLTKINKSLSKYNLDNILPAQQANLTVDTVLKDTNARLNEVLTAKTDQDRKLALGKYNAEIQLLFASIARERATAYNQQQQGRQAGIMGDLYTPGSPGYNLMRNEAAAASWNSHINKYKYLSERDIYNELMDRYLFTMKSRYDLDVHKSIDRQGKVFGPVLRTADDYLPFGRGYTPLTSGRP